MPTTIHRLKITLRSVRPPIWRRIEVRSEIALGELSDLLEAAMGWFGGHLHSFEADDVSYETNDPDEGLYDDAKDESKHLLDEVLATVGSKMRWEYDFGDSWQHEIVVEAIEPAAVDAIYPRCVNGRRACPPEDSGGPSSYAEFLDTRPPTSGVECVDEVDQESVERWHELVAVVGRPEWAADPQVGDSVDETPQDRQEIESVAFLSPTARLVARDEFGKSEEAAFPGRPEFGRIDSREFQPTHDAELGSVIEGETGVGLAGCEQCLSG